MKYMFREATSFDSNLRIWNTSKVTNMEDMFNGATAFNQPIGGWITSEVRNMSSMFNGATAFNQTIGDWETSKVEDMSYMFRKATSFNSDIGGWDTRNVAKMSYMFLEATSFDSDLSRWNTGKVTNMEYMFLGATSFARCLPATFIMGTFVGIFSDSSGSASSTCGSSTPANPAGGGGGGGGLILPPASASASASATAVSVISIDRGLVQAGSLITLFGTKLDLVAGASIDGVGLVIRSQSPTSLTLLLPGVISDGVKDIVLSSIQGFYTARAILKISAQAVDAPAALERKVNAGSFKGFVAIYARGYEGARLSAKVGKDWVIINRIPKRSGDLFRVVEFTGAGVNVQVRVFIDRVLLATIPLKTK
jgi:surface protein